MVDYSKWNHIEISDDEDETHPNIDTQSLFRWRHQARVERMEEQSRSKEEHQSRKDVNAKNLKEARNRLADAERRGDSDIMPELKAALREVELESESIHKVEDELRKKEQKTPWNVDTISTPGFQKTVINKKVPRVTDEDLTEEEREQRMNKFIKENEKSIKHFGMLRKYDDSRQYLKANPHLLCDDTSNYLVYWCIQLEMEEKHELMGHVAHQTVCMQYILEIAKQIDYDPRACLDGFYSKIQVADVEYRASFMDELEQLKKRIQTRAEEKTREAIRKVEEEERQNRLGPGGLDPSEVFETLPEELQKCFETQDIGMLQETIAKMNPEDAKHHMKRCVDSGLWVPDAKKGKKDNSEEDSDGFFDASSEEPTKSAEDAKDK